MRFEPADVKLRIERGHAEALAAAFPELAALREQLRFGAVAEVALKSLSVDARRPPAHLAGHETSCAHRAASACGLILTSTRDATTPMLRMGPLYGARAVMSAQFGLDLPAALIDELVDLFPAATGRDIKGLAKLVAKYCAHKNVAPGIEVIRRCSIFRGMDLGASAAAPAAVRAAA